jgi:hypothetical protein
MPIQTAADSISNSAGSPYGFKNRIINGAMVIDQRNAGAAVTTSNTSSPWITDRWSAYSSANTLATAIHTTQQQTTVVPPGFSHALKTTVTFGGSSYERAYYQIIEGLNVADLGWGTVNAKTITVSFWVQASITGTFAFSLRNYNGTFSYVSMQTINSANTWEYKTITIPGPTSGTWTVSNSWGIICEICLGHSIGISANLLTTASPNTWVNVNAITTSSLTNFVATTGNTFYFTGFQFEVGSQATAFDYRDYGRELQLCQRYYETSYVSGTAIGTATSSNIIWWYAQSSGNYNNQVTFYKVTKRVPATIVFYSTLGTSGKITNQDTVVDVTGRLINSGTNNITIGADNVSIGQWVAIAYHYTASAEL